MSTFKKQSAEHIDNSRASSLDYRKITGEARSESQIAPKNENPVGFSFFMSHYR
ncbi:hypothetical protein [Paucilactobacillus nenjiangensis]|uniref:hypothetical protein n=1 Tax=Paucilactobacillus nenjiangensis TaxID=1296540 RepID=UPI00147760F3|nr:hypothetical protein [Paucilactobacillus nenjiangensis]